MEPTVPIPPEAITPEMLRTLDLIAIKRGLSIEQAISEAVDRYILAESDQNN